MSAELAALGEGGEEDGSGEGVWEEHAEALLAEMDGTTAGEPRGAGSARRGSSPRMLRVHARAHGLAQSCLPRRCGAASMPCSRALQRRTGGASPDQHAPRRSRASCRCVRGVHSPAQGGRCACEPPVLPAPALGAGLIAGHACCAVPGVCRGPRGMRAARRAQQRHPRRGCQRCVPECCR